MAKNKQKTHKGASKRFKVTGTGKVSHRSQKFRHLLSKKSSKRIRSLRLEKNVEGRAAKKIKQLLGVA
ncbi:50S ribosomal protein L35 [Candidatus Roizmanbacteria bacterium]|nr:MAG: 50S ribosomal protein L35 [Candidatus Roizmanbacteria bacterium]